MTRAGAVGAGGTRSAVRKQQSIEGKQGQTACGSQVVASVQWCHRSGASSPTRGHLPAPQAERRRNSEPRRLRPPAGHATCVRPLPGYGGRKVQPAAVLRRIHDSQTPLRHGGSHVTGCGQWVVSGRERGAGPRRARNMPPAESRCLPCGVEVWLQRSGGLRGDACGPPRAGVWCVSAGMRAWEGLSCAREEQLAGPASAAAEDALA